MISISETTFDDLWEHSRAQYRQWDPQHDDDVTFDCPDLLGHGFKRDIGLRNGIDLTFYNYQLHQDVQITGVQEGHANCLEWIFSLSSGFRYDATLTIAPGQHHVASQYLGGGICEEWAAAPRIEVNLHLTPERFTQLIDDDPTVISPELHQLLAGDPVLKSSAVREITPAMRLALQQMLDCPYQGTTKLLYLESKSLEVLTLWLEQSRTEQPLPQRQTPDHIEQIYQARDILLESLNAPPSLMTLAHQVGLNDCTLKRCFKQVFGTTVFGYLYEQRMQQARQKLQETTQTISIIAQAVGYHDTSAFSHAFRRRFGQSPKHLRQGFSSER